MMRKRTKRTTGQALDSELDGPSHFQRVHSRVTAYIDLEV